MSALATEDQTDESVMIEAFDDLTQRYEVSRHEVERGAELFATSVERAADLRAEYVAMSNLLRREGIQIPRLMPGVLGGGSSQAGLIERFRAACTRRW